MGVMVLAFFLYFFIGLAILSSPVFAGCRKIRATRDWVRRLRGSRATIAAPEAARKQAASGSNFTIFRTKPPRRLCRGRPMASMAKILGKPELVKNAVFSKFKYILDNFGSTQTYNPDEGGDYSDSELKWPKL